MTVRSLSNLKTNLFQDGQVGGISAADIRDLTDSAIGISGWADYADNQYSSGSPFSITASTDTRIPNNAGAAREQELPLDYPGGFWSVANQLMLEGANEGDSFDLLIEFTIQRASGSGAYNLQTWLDIALGGSFPGNPLYKETVSLPGQGAQSHRAGFPIYTLDTWSANGARVYINTSVNTEIYDIRFVLHRRHRGRGTYPPP